jgi:uncharacterized membrane protein
MEAIARNLPPGIGFEWSGTSFEERQSGSQAPFLFGISLIVVFLCLAALYESWSIPFAVMLVVPLGIFGAVSAVMLRGLPNDVYFKVGLIAIIGLSAKNAILIIEFARELQEQGKELVAATTRSLPAALPADPDDLDRLHLRRAAAGDLHRRRRQQPPCHRHRRDGRHDCGDGSGGLPRAGILCRRAAHLPRPRSPSCGVRS